MVIMTIPKNPIFVVFLCRGYSAVAVLVDILRYAAPHIGIRPTSVKRFSFFAGIKNRWG
ncbi:hypothetical protein SGB_04114 [Shigella boydii ATCC 9905]|nr:hypothetical protein SGB_04114 [Shigella boydii ATCC 9905]